MYKKIMNFLIMWFTGGTIYFFIEIIARGYSHYSMFICGGLCFATVGSFYEWLLSKRKNKGITEYIGLNILGLVSGGLIITLLEFITGIIVNVILGIGVWDYSGMKYNFMGQICLEYSFLWIILSGVIVKIYKDINRYILE